MRGAGILLLLASTVLAGCEERQKEPADTAVRETTGPEQSGPTAASPVGPVWAIATDATGTALILRTAPGQGSSGQKLLSMECPAGARRILVNVPEFRPIGSEERMSFGSGEHVEALVADVRGDKARGGVTGAGPVPANLAALLGGRIGVSYGAQISGPHPQLPAAIASAFVDGCLDTGTAKNVSACEMQDGLRLALKPLRAVGTEPFWAARIEGRCVTYSTPEDIGGTRIWTRYGTGDGEIVWTGAFKGQRFELRTRVQPGCSDGMSDTRYPLAVDLFVRGEQRSGCGELLP